MLDSVVQSGLAIVLTGLTIVLTLIMFILKQLSTQIKENRVDLKEHIQEDTRRFEIFQKNLTDFQLSVAKHGNGKGN